MIHPPGILVMALGFLAMIGPLVFVHELGHYFVGRLFGVKVDSFSIGMGRELAGWTDRRGTRWKLSALPIGGYVKFFGDLGPASAVDPAWQALPADLRARTLAGRPVWQRFLVVLAGPLTNFVAAIAIFSLYFAMVGVPQTPTLLSAVVPGSAAAHAGIRPGDRILAVDGRRVATFEDLTHLIQIRPRERLTIAIERAGQPLAIPVVTAAVPVDDGTGNRVEIGQLGVSPGPQVTTRPGLAGVLAAAVGHTWGSLRMMVELVGQIVTGARPVSQLGGPLKIAQYSGTAATFGWLPFIQLMALISINLGFVNLLPIPLLDGGHLLFYLMEGVRRRPLPARAQEWAFRSGLAMLLGFMLFATANDLASFGLWRKLAGLIG